MSVFVDTSGLIAMLDADEARHHEAAARWRQLVEEDEPLVATNYVMLETLALTQRRLGLDAVRLLVRDVVPLLDIEWVGEDAHEAAVAVLVAANRRSLSLVDCASFETMRRRGLTQAFAFDQHFAEQGFAGP
ncbi:MAG TPA: PIN domain-containing protein [Thermoanaerobaculia bacterium]|jgi:predicted nucleic acid-binding protein|nr:PIN domain-containing protein [Thermoanaerobaculia bacterium]